MAESLSLVDLDTLRADTMRAFLNAEGRRYIWQYDVVTVRGAYRIALEDQDYDNLQTDGTALIDGKPYALIGSGICDHPFSTAAELVSLLAWLCFDGYLSCYKADRPIWAPHLDETKLEIADWKGGA